MDANFYLHRICLTESYKYLGVNLDAENDKKKLKTNIGYRSTQANS